MNFFSLDITSVYSWVAAFAFFVLPLIALIGSLLPSRVREAKVVFDIEASIDDVWRILHEPESGIVKFTPGTHRSVEIERQLDLNGELESISFRDELSKSSVRIAASRLDRPHSFTWHMADATVPLTIVVRVALVELEPARRTRLAFVECATVRDGAWQVPFLRIVNHLQPGHASRFIGEQVQRHFATKKTHQ